MRKKEWKPPQPGRAARPLSGCRAERLTLWLDRGADRPGNGAIRLHVWLRPDRAVGCIALGGLPGHRV